MTRIFRNYTKISNAAKALKSQIEEDMADDNSTDSGVTTETSSRTSYSSTTRSTKSTRSTRSKATNKSARTHGSLSSYSSSIFTTDKDCKIKTRAKFSEKIIWDGRRTAFTALFNLIMRDPNTCRVRCKGSAARWWQGRGRRACPCWSR